MKKMHVAASLITLFLLNGCQATTPPAQAATPPKQQQQQQQSQSQSQQPVVQLAILLDTSGSMDGLIDQAKAQLWKIVNEFGAASQNGQTPRLEVALYDYGRSDVDAEKGHLRQLLSFTSDLDRVSEELFKLQTNGGDEWCGYALKTALHDLQWDKNPKTLKLVFIAGNEPFTQGPVAYAPVLQEAVQRDILVNTIYCGAKAAGVSEGWQNGAVAGQGRFLVIDQNQAVAYQETPQDKQLADLSNKLNSSYVAYGADGGAALGRQTKMDTYSSSLSPAVAAERAQVKSSKSSYSNANWDLVDAVKDKKVDLTTLKNEELPPEMQSLKPEQRAEYVAGKQKERDELQQQIQDLSKQRAEYLAAHATKEQGTLQQAVLEAVRAQGKAKGYTFKSR